MNEKQKSRSGSAPQISLSIPKPLIGIVKSTALELVESLKEHNIASVSHLVRLMILRGKVVDGKLVVNLSEADEVK